MGKKSKWRNLSLVWKAIVGVSVIIGIPASIATLLQILGAIDIWGLLILPSYNFLMISVPVYLVLFIVMVLTLTFLTIKSTEHQISILDSDYTRRIAILCQAPRTTEYLRAKYAEWSHGILLHGGYNFDDYIKQLEKQGYLVYTDGKWTVTNKALGYIRKYFGGYGLIDS